MHENSKGSTEDRDHMCRQPFTWRRPLNNDDDNTPTPRMKFLYSRLTNAVHDNGMHNSKQERLAHLIVITSIKSVTFVHCAQTVKDIDTHRRHWQSKPGGDTSGDLLVRPPGIRMHSARQQFPRYDCETPNVGRRRETETKQDFRSRPANR